VPNTAAQVNDGFVPGTRRQPVPAAGVLRGLRLSVKDVIDVAGLPTGAGQPAWLATHRAPTEHAESVARLLGAGAAFVGKTQTDELAWSLLGSNAHYGTPDNPRATGHLPGGSSSGAASTVASGAADLGLGTDTAGSIRVPASWCGLWSLRPSHHRVPRSGTVPLAPDYDVTALLARDLATLDLGCRVLLDPTGPADAVQRLIVPDDLWADPVTTRGLGAALSRLKGAFRSTADSLPATPVNAFVTTQGAQVWREHAAWVMAHSPQFGPGVSARMRAASELRPAQIRAAGKEVSQFAGAVRARLSASTVLVLPSTPCSAPPTGPPVAPLLRRRLLSLTTIASIAGLPALNLPVGSHEGLPLGLSLVGAPGADEQLLELARSLVDLVA
jgi:amidase